MDENDKLKIMPKEFGKQMVKESLEKVREALETVNRIMKNFVEEYGEEVVRSEIRVGLAKCTEPQRMLFKRIYANGDLELSIEDIVKKVKGAKLNHALDQVNRTLIKNAGLRGDCEMNQAEYDDSETNVIAELTGTIERLRDTIAQLERERDENMRAIKILAEKESCYWCMCPACVQGRIDKAIKQARAELEAEKRKP